MSNPDKSNVHFVDFGRIDGFNSGDDKESAENVRDIEISLQEMLDLVKDLMNSLSPEGDREWAVSAILLSVNKLLRSSPIPNELPDNFMEDTLFERDTIVACEGVSNEWVVFTSEENFLEASRRIFAMALAKREA